MQILPLLNKSLKDNDILEVLEWGEAYVIYDFDRSHENLPDVYWAHCKKRGICMRFNEEQKLDTIFFYVLGIEGYTPLELSEIDDMMFYAGFADVKTYAISGNLAYKTGERPNSLPPRAQWIRVDQEGYSLHYDFRDEGLTLVTIMAT